MKPRIERAFGERLGDLMEELDATAGAVASSVAVHRATIQRWKKGQLPRATQLEALAQALGTSVAYLRRGAGRKRVGRPTLPFHPLDRAFRHARETLDASYRRGHLPTRAARRILRQLEREVQQAYARATQDTPRPREDDTYGIGHPLHVLRPTPGDRGAERGHRAGQRRG